MTSNRERAMASAIELLGTEGVRSLTHARVDERSGLPRGSTSNYFRTRAALFHGVVEHMLAREAPGVVRAFAPTTPEELVDSLSDLFAQLVGPGRTITSARLALYVEAAHDADLRDALGQGRSAIIDPVVGAFRSLGARDPELSAQLVATVFEGLFLQVLGGHVAVDVDGILRATVEVALR